MIFNNDILFLHVPKTGGMSMTSLLLAHLPGPVYYTTPHADIEHLPDRSDLHILDGIRHENLHQAKGRLGSLGRNLYEFRAILVVMRNPYDLEASRFAYLQRNHHWDPLEERQLAGSGDFEQFCRESTFHGREQICLQDYFLDEGEIPATLKILRFEHLAADLRHFFSIYLPHVVDSPLPHQNRSERKYYQAYLTGASEKTIYRRYAWFFEQGFYSRESLCATHRKSASSWVLALSCRFHSRLEKRVPKLFRTLQNSNWGYSWILAGRSGHWRPTGVPNATWCNSVLCKRTESLAATEQVQELGLQGNFDSVKDWDSLAALSLIIKEIPQNKAILDAGGELYSKILPWLYRYGYRNLNCINLAFEGPTMRGSIDYRPGDLTCTEYKAQSFSAITCLSVLEHGVNISDFFEEMWRLLTPGGLLVLSTDYFDSTVDTTGKSFYGHSVKVFNRAEIENLLTVANRKGFELLGPLNLKCEDKVVYWRAVDLQYTFLLCSFRKMESNLEDADL